MSHKEDIELGFHNQFAENQNHHQKLFFQTLSIVVTVIIGYGYVYTSGGEMGSTDTDPSLLMLSAALWVASLMLGAGSVILLNMAYGFRRDQLVVCRIRQKAGLLGTDHTSDSLSDEHIFPKTFDPTFSLKRKFQRYHDHKERHPRRLMLLRPAMWWQWVRLKLTWMPNFHSYLFGTLTLLQIILLGTYLLNPASGIPDILAFGWMEIALFTMTVGVWIFFVGFSMRTVRSLLKKLFETYGIVSGIQAKVESSNHKTPTNDA